MSRKRESAPVMIMLTTVYFQTTRHVQGVHHPAIGKAFSPRLSMSSTPRLLAAGNGDRSYDLVID